jgi:hypothetical protein
MGLAGVVFTPQTGQMVVLLATAWRRRWLRLALDLGCAGQRDPWHGLPHSLQARRIIGGLAVVARRTCTNAGLVSTHASVCWSCTRLVLLCVWG